MKYAPRLKIYRGSNRKNTFNPDTFEGRSYDHWLYVKKVKGHVIFNCYQYSVTTSKHQHEMYRFLFEELGVSEKSIITVNQEQSLGQGIFIDTLYKALYLAEIRVKRKGMRKDYIKEQLDTIKQSKAKIKVLRSIGAKTEIDLDTLKNRVLNDEIVRLTKNREQSRAMREMRKTIVNEVKEQFNSFDAVSI